MNIPEKQNPDQVKPGKQRHLLKGLGIFCASIVGIILIVLCGISLFLTPERLTKIVNREASQYLEADVCASGISYTLWRSFPLFSIKTDSIVVISRTLDSISPEIRRQLPENAEFLGSLKSFSGSINIIDLLLNRYVLRDVKVDGLRINLVAYNDSINNFNILSANGAGMKRVPYFSAHTFSLHNPGAMSYYSKASDTYAVVRLSDFLLKRIDESRHENDYHLTISGDVTANSSGLNVLHDFPFNLSGDLQLRFDPFGIRLKDYAIDLGSLKSRLTMNIGMGDNPRIESFDYHISTGNLMSILDYLPEAYIPSLEGLNADMPVDASARLLSAWNFSNEVFPSLEINFSIPEGEIGYTLSSKSTGSQPVLHTYNLGHSAINAQFIFDGEHPDSSYLAISPFILSAPGLESRISGRVSQLTTSPLVDTRIDMKAALADAMQNLPMSPGLNLSGNLKGAIDLTFRLAGVTHSALTKGFEAIAASGNFDISGLKLSAPADAYTLTASNIGIKMGEEAAAISLQGLDDPLSRFLITIDNARASTSQGDITVSNLAVATHASFSGELTPQQLNNGLPLHFDIKSGELGFFTPDGTGAQMNARIENLTISDFVATHKPSSFRQALSDGLTIKASHAKIAAGDRTYLLTHPSMHIAVAERKDMTISALATIPAKVKADTLPVKADKSVKEKSDPLPPHSPEFINPGAPQWLSGLFNRFSFSTDFKVDRFNMERAGKMESDYLSDVDITLNEEALTLRNLSMTLSETPASLKGRIGNLRNFLTLPPSADNPLEIDLKADIDRIDINRLARNYVASKGGEKNIARHDTPTASDSVAMLVPRNIKANIDASVGMIDYTNLHLTDVDADINVSDGVADIHRLALASSFGSAEASFIYDSSDIRNMSLTADVDLQQLNIVNFFKKFHSLLEMMPQMKNLSGNISMKAHMGTLIFPDMYLNIPSAYADVDILGYDLKVHQSHFIRKITKMMLIRNDDDIHIKDLNVHAAMRDNLLQLYPFNFEFEGYKLHMLGVNNFYGRLYYHIAVEKSPVPFPFAINVEGWFHDPKLRFGGPHYDIRRGEEVTAEIQESNSVNMMKVLKGFLREFICSAARSKE